MRSKLCVSHAYAVSVVRRKFKEIFQFVSFPVYKKLCSFTAFFTVAKRVKSAYSSGTLNKMLIDQIDAFKTWLAAVLKPL